MYESLFKLIDDGKIKNDEILAAVNSDIDLENKIIVMATHPFKRRNNDEFRCGIEHISLIKRWDSDADIAIRKLLSISTTTIIHCGTIIEHQGDMHNGYYKYWDGINSFLKIISRYRELVEANFIVPIPSYSFTNDDDMGDFNNPEDRLNINKEIGKETLEINLEIEDIKKQFFELSNSENSLPAGSVDIFLPHFKNITTNEIIKLRMNEQNAFIKYHRYLEKFFLDSSRSYNERDILNCLKDIDNGIREIDSIFKIIKKKNLYNSLGVTVGLSCVALCLFMPKEIAEYIRAIVGGATGVATLKYLASKVESFEKIINKEFYFPWLIHRKR
jgi:hypothetical protein